MNDHHSDLIQGGRTHHSETKARKFSFQAVYFESL